MLNRGEMLKRRMRRGWYKVGVGGLWDEMGRAQVSFLIDQGLQSHHKVLDIGCGSLRGGLHFVRHLDSGNYFGVDADSALLKAGKRELTRNGLAHKKPRLLHNQLFEFALFGEHFDFALAQSVFTHLPFNSILRCLNEVERVLVPGGRFFATFFRNDDRGRVEPFEIATQDGVRLVVNCDRDPFYYDPDLFRWAVEGTSLQFTLHGEWGHPRHQQMAVFAKAL